MKTIRWNGHEIKYNPDDLIPLLARVAQITRENKFNDSKQSKREDKPLCPFCNSRLSRFGTSRIKSQMSDTTLYCSSTECTGLSITGNNTGYDISLCDI